MKIFINILVLSFLCFNSAFSQKYLKIVGIKNENIESVDILKYEKKYSDSISVISNLINLRNELYNIGFISASIDTIYSIKDTIYSNIYLGKKFRWGKINFDSVDSTVLKKLKVHQSNYKNKIVKLNDYNILAEKIVNYYESIGFPFVLCSLSNVDFNDSIISADCNVSKNQKYYIKSIILKGNAKI
ncbi:MAG: hypothetical protein U9R54_07455, partial [Bacteroidota bacterium]|nr:hypothetical protein [Bacteroidota bacterium]